MDTAVEYSLRRLERIVLKLCKECGLDNDSIDTITLALDVRRDNTITLEKEKKWRF